MHSTEFAWLSDEMLLKGLTLKDRRPSLMIVARGVALEAVTDRLMMVCTQPVLTSVLPGKLHLPASKCGTVLLQNITALSLPQQIVLNDWLGEGPGEAQIVSITTTHLWRLVQSGDFLEGLFYRLNVVSLNATPQSRDAADDGEGEYRGLPRA